MNYIVQKDKIIIYNLEDFNAEHILECGQIFTYEKISENEYNVLSKDKLCKVQTFEDRVELLTQDTAYFENFFDLKTNYSAIKNELVLLHQNLSEVIEFGKGIRILKQDIFETVIGFIISANNNIGRIRNSMRFLRENAGQKMGNYNAFPTLETLLKFDEEFFTKAGLGYRAKQIVKGLKDLENFDFEASKNWDTQLLKQELLKVCGIGSKVADCIMLFGYGKGDVFPVDTWIEKVYHDFFDKTEKNREIMRKVLVNTFKNLSGYAQQYLFYYKRSFV